MNLNIFGLLGHRHSPGEHAWMHDFLTLSILYTQDKGSQNSGHPSREQFLSPFRVITCQENTLRGYHPGFISKGCSLGPIFQV